MRVIFIAFCLHLWFWPLQARENGFHFSRDNIATMASSGEVRSVEDMLDALFATQGEKFLRSYVLMFHSRSVQDASFENPRVLLFSEKDEFVVTFNGESNQIEMMVFDREDRKFKFFEIDFEKPPLERVSNVNPQKCMGCHGLGSPNDPRPHWEPYPVWPGMYGGFDDNLTVSITYYQDMFGKDFIQGPESFLSTYNNNNIFELREAQEYLNFHRKKEQHERYSRLADFNTDYFVARPGLRLTDLLVRLNRDRITRKLEEAIQKAPIFKYAFLGAAYCFSSLFPVMSMDQLIPHHLMEDREHLIDYWNRYTDIVIKDLERRISIHEGTTKQKVSGNRPFIPGPNLAPIKYVMEMAGLNAHGLSLSFSDTPIMYPGYSTPLIKKDAVLSILEKGYYNGDHREITFNAYLYRGSSSFGTDPQLCHELGTKSLKELRGYGGERRAAN